jgi:hypothetical protein
MPLLRVLNDGGISTRSGVKTYQIYQRKVGIFAVDTFVNVKI